MNTGFVLGGYNTTGIIIEKQQNWSRNITILITAFGVLGLAIGSLTGSVFLRLGRIKALLIANILVIVSIVPYMWLSEAGLTIGRFILGIGSGLMIPSLSVFIAETIPKQYRSTVGTSVNFGILVGLLVSNLI